MSEGSPPSEHAQATFARGASIGRYVVLGLVGRGGMGEVYAAYDPELDRKVAVKLLRIKPGAGVSLVEGKQRTLREAQAIARLSHPNVVVVFDVGTFEEKVFIAMEFLEGNTAGFWSQSQHRTWQETLKVYVAAGRGLAAAHDKGLVHRDFKPDNVMVGRDGQVRVMDFGLARQAEKPFAGTSGANPISAPSGDKASGSGERPIVTTQKLPGIVAEPGAPVRPLDGSTLVLASPDSDARAPEPEVSTSVAFDQRLTRTGAMMGTPAYMAPEQFRGHPTDARTDQFAFCIALYEALYGERPFAGNTLMQLTTNVVNGKIREAPTATKVPLWIRKILLRGLRVNADDRWASMEELLTALGKDPAVKRRTAGIVVLSALTMAFVTVGIRQSIADPRAVCSGGPAKLAGIWEPVDSGEPETPRQARLHDAFLKSGKSYAKDVWATTSRALTNYARAWADMHKQACEATTVRREQSAEVMDLRMACLDERLGGLRALTDVFASANGEVVENAVSASNALGSLDRCADVPLLRAIVRPPEDATTKQKVDDLRKRLAVAKAGFDAGRWREGLSAAPAIAMEARATGYQPLVAETLVLTGLMYGKGNDVKNAEKALIEAFLIADECRHDEVRAEAATHLVFLVGYQEGQLDEAHRWARRANAVLRRLGGHELLQAWLRNDLGCVYDLQGDKKAAVQAIKEGLALKEKALGSEHPDVGISEGNLGLALQGLGQHEEALVHLNRSIALLEKGMGYGHPELALHLSNRGEALSALGRYEEAHANFQRALLIWEKELGSDNLDLAYGLTGLGVAFLAQRKPTEALVPLERAFRIRSTQENEPSRRGDTAFALARALWDSNRDRARAVKLVAAAKDDYAKAVAPERLKQIDQWLLSREPIARLK
jgi:serine/threonine protein kinase/tetratricopeptide (TPR) repeat protein